MNKTIDSPGAAKWLFLPMLLYFIISCTKTEVESYPSLYFMVTDSLIGEQRAFGTQHLILHPPVGLLRISDADFSEFQATVHEDTSMFLPTDPLFAGATPYGLFMVVSQVTTGPDGLSVFDDIYTSYLESKYPDCDINRTQFSLNDIHTVQYIIMNQTSVSIKLYCMVDDRCTQVDYFLARDRYMDTAHILEASIGSINRKNEED